MLLAVLQADVGSRRKISTHRILRPMPLAAIIVRLFLKSVVTHGNGLAIEIAGLPGQASMPNTPRSKITKCRCSNCSARCSTIDPQGQNSQICVR